MGMLLSSKAVRCSCLLLITGSSWVAAQTAEAPSPPPLESETACQPSCQNGGRCQWQEASGVYACNCENTGYTDKSCQIGGSGAWKRADNRLCNSSCMHGGNCMQAADNSFFCECSATGYTGTNCTLPTPTPFFSSGLPAPPGPNTTASSNDSSNNAESTVPSANPGAGMTGWGIAIILLAIGIALLVSAGLVVFLRRRRKNVTRFERFEQRPSVEFYGSHNSSSVSSSAT